MSKEVQVKNFKVTFFKKPEKTKEKFEVEVRANSKDDAIDKALSRIGSKHKISRDILIVKSVKELDADDLKDPVLREIAKNDGVKIIPEHQQQ